MGDYTRYSLIVREYQAQALSPEAAIEDLRSTSEDAACCLQPDGTAEESGKWYEHANELRELSKRYPHLLFELHGEGDEPGDIWTKYFVGGRMQEAKAKVQVAPFDPDALA